LRRWSPRESPVAPSGAIREFESEPDRSRRVGETVPCGGDLGSTRRSSGMTRPFVLSGTSRVRPHAHPPPRTAEERDRLARPRSARRQLAICCRAAARWRGFAPAGAIPIVMRLRRASSGGSAAPSPFTIDCGGSGWRNRAPCPRPSSDPALRLPSGLRLAGWRPFLTAPGARSPRGRCTPCRPTPGSREAQCFRADDPCPFERRP
jgi:hypothetical protein